MLDLPAVSLYADVLLPACSLKSRDRMRLQRLLRDLLEQDFAHTQAVKDYIEEIVRLNDAIIRIKQKSGFSLLDPNWLKSAQKIIKTNINLALRIPKDPALMPNIGLAAEGVIAACQLLQEPQNQIAAKKLEQAATALHQATAQRENGYRHPMGMNEKTRKKLRTSSLIFAVLSAFTAFALISCLFVCSSYAVTLALPLILGVGILLSVAGVLKLIAAERYFKLAGLYKRTTEFNQSIDLSRKLANSFTSAKDPLSHRSLAKHSFFKSKPIDAKLDDDRYTAQANAETQSIFRMMARMAGGF